MDFRHMEYVMAIVESGGRLTKAAERLRISQPALSCILRKAEAECGMTLFDRGRNPMALTAAGRRYAKAARAVMSIGESLEREFADEKSLRSGELRVGTTPFRAGYLLPGVLCGYHKKYPDVNVTVTEAPNTDLLRLAEESLVDLAIGNIPLERKKACLSLALHPLCREELVLALSPSHPLAGKERLSDISVLSNETLILSPKGEPLREVIDNFFARENFTAGRTIETNNPELAFRLLAEGVGVLIVSDAVCGAENTPLRPAYVRFANMNVHWETSLFYPNQRYMSFAAAAFVGEITGARVPPG